MITRMEYALRRAKDYVQTDGFKCNRVQFLLGERYYWLCQRDRAKIARKRAFCQTMADMYAKRIKWYLR